VLILCIKSYLFISVSNVGVNEIALALLTTISIPPNLPIDLLTASAIWLSSLTSTTQGKHFPPASSTKKL